MALDSYLTALDYTIIVFNEIAGNITQLTVGSGAMEGYVVFTGTDKNGHFRGVV